MIYLNQKEIAEVLGISPAKFSRIKLLAEKEGFPIPRWNLIDTNIGRQPLWRQDHFYEVAK